MKTYTLKVERKISETNDTTTFCFKQPSLKKIKYYPGQYLTVIVNINGRRYLRPYSFSSSPGLDSTLDITVKRVLLGIVSNHLIDALKEGDLIEVLEPMGEFILKESHHLDKAIFLWGAGSGITPLMSILKVALSKGSRNVTLNYCNPTRLETIFYNQLQLLRQRYINKFDLNIFLTKEKCNDTYHGRISKNHIKEIVKKCNDLPQSLHFICGPEGLKKDIVQVLYSHGLTSETVFSEEFDNIIDEHDLNGVITQPVQLSLSGSNNTFEVVRGKSILEAGLDFGLDIPYSCQTGVCKLCKANLISGAVKSIGNTSDSELMMNEYLLCCSYPLSENVIFEIE